MSKEIQEYILNYYRYRSFSPTDLAKETNKYYNEVCETVKAMGYGLSGHETTWTLMVWW